MSEYAYSDLLKYLNDVIPKKRALVGVDGFIDEIIRIVDKRYDGGHYTTISTLEDFGNRIIESKGMSLNVELISLKKKLGGNGPIYANALAKMGYTIDYLGTIGEDSVHPIFSEIFSKESKCVCVGEPAYTDAYEFNDGKLISSRLDSLNTLSWSKIESKINPDSIAAMINETNVITFNNWTMIPAMSNIWEHFLDEVVSKIKADIREKIAFFDLADPKKRSEEDIRRALMLIKEFKKCGFKTMLGTNFKEARQLASVIEKKNNEASLEDAAKVVADFMDIDSVVVHKIDGAVCIQGSECVYADAYYCENPILKTGCGDNFNAGFVFGQALGWPPMICVKLGNITASYYVRNGEAASLDQLREFLTSI